MSIDRKILNKLQSILWDYDKNNPGKFPKIKWIAQWMGLSYYKTVEALRILEAEKFLSRNYNQYKLLSKKPTSQPSARTADGPSSVKTAPKKDLTLIVIRVVMAIIGLISIGLSIYFTQFWFREFFTPFLSIMLSLSLVSFSVIAFEVTIIFWKKHQHILVILFGLMWGMVLIFSMMSTLAAQFNTWSIKEKQASSGKIQNANQKLIFNEYDKEKQEVLLRISEERIELHVNQNILQQFNTLEKRKQDWKFYWSTKQFINESQIEIDRLEQLLKEVRNKSQMFLESNQEISIIEKEQVFSFYIWISQMVKVDSAYIRFWLFIIPAVAIDILAAVGIALALFLKKE